MTTTKVSELAYDYVVSRLRSPNENIMELRISWAETMGDWFKEKGGEFSDYNTFCDLVHYFMRNRVEMFLSEMYVNQQYHMDVWPEFKEITHDVSGSCGRGE